MMMKVLMIGPARSVHGGISGMVNNYYDAGLQSKIDLCYIGTMVDGSKGRKLLQACRAYLAFLGKLPGYQIVHVNMASDSSYYRKSVFIRTARLFHKKIVIHQHGGSFEEFYYTVLREKGRQKVKKILSMGDAFLVLGTNWKTFFGAIVNPERITVLPNAVPIPEKREKQYGVHKLLFLGRLCKTKGIAELLTVMPAIWEKYPDVRLYLGGVWEDEDLKAKAQALSFCVTDLGWITGEEKQKYLQDCDIFVLPSYFEGLPVSVLEAMANACGIVVSQTGAVTDMIEHKETGILILPQDTESLKEGLFQLLDSPDLCEKLGKSAREKAEKEFSIEENIRKLLRIYDYVLAKERGI